jgi:hypothetical protein
LASTSARTPRRIGWANLRVRVFAADVTVCSTCGGRMKILGATDPTAIAELLHGARAPPRARPPRQLWIFVPARAEASRAASCALAPTQRWEISRPNSQIKLRRRRSTLPKSAY